MPKVKKNKIVSLVAYESGAESDNDNAIESDEESESSKSENQSEQESEEETQLKPKKANESDETQDTLSEDTRSNASSKLSQPNEPVSEKDEVETQVNTTELVASSSVDSKYTIENGFPPGCSNIKIPSPTSAPCSQALQNKIIQVMDRMNKYNYSINDDIYRKKQFKNPSIYEKLIEVYGINEYGSNFPDHIEDLKSNGYIVYDELNEIQMQSWAKQDKEKQAKTKVEVVSGVKKKLSIN